MFQRISKSEEIHAKLSKEGKVSYLDQPKHNQAIDAMNVSMENVRRDFQSKDQNSQQSARSVKLTS